MDNKNAWCMGVGCLDASLIFSVFSFAIHRRVLFFEPFLTERRVWGRRWEGKKRYAANLDFSLVSLLPPIAAGSFSPKSCLFLNHKAGWTIRSKQRFHLESHEKEEKRFQIKREFKYLKIFTFSKKRRPNIYRRSLGGVEQEKSWGDMTTTAYNNTYHSLPLSHPSNN